MAIPKGLAKARMQSVDSFRLGDKRQLTSFFPLGHKEGGPTINWLILNALLRLQENDGHGTTRNIANLTGLRACNVSFILNRMAKSKIHVKNIGGIAGNARWKLRVSKLAKHHDVYLAFLREPNPKIPKVQKIHLYKLKK